MKIGNKLKTLRLDQGQTSKELAELSGVSQSTISEIESDNRSPSLDTLEKICSALNVPIMEVLPVEHHLNAGLQSISEQEIKVLNLLHKMDLDERNHFVCLFNSLLLKRKK